MNGQGDRREVWAWFGGRESLEVGGDDTVIRRLLSADVECMEVKLCNKYA